VRGFRVHLRHRAARLHAGPAAVAALRLSTHQLTPSSLRIGSGATADKVGLVLDNGNKCFSALHFINLYRILLALYLASISVLLPATPTHPITHLASSAPFLPAGVTIWCFLATSNDIRCVCANRTGSLTHLTRSLTYRQHAPGFPTKVGNR
jgi:hypothetical protein